MSRFDSLVAVAANTLRFCPECAVSLPEDARKCPDCGHVLKKSMSGVFVVLVAVALACALMAALWIAFGNSPPIDPGV